MCLVSRYTVFERAGVVINAECGPRLRTLLRNTLIYIRVLNSIRTPEEIGLEKVTADATEMVLHVSSWSMSNSEWRLSLFLYL